MIKLLKQFTAWLDGASKADLEQELAHELEKKSLRFKIRCLEREKAEQVAINASLYKENQELRARNRELMKRK